MYPKEVSHDADRIAEAPPKTPYKKLYVYEGDNLIYECWAAPGTLTSAARWAIKKRTYVGANCTMEQWANGNTMENNVADDAAALTYY